MTNVCKAVGDLSDANCSQEPHERYFTLQTGLDMLDQGLSIFDANLRLVAWNRAYIELLGFPEHMAWLGAPFQSFIEYNAKRGDYGPGDAAAQVAERVEAARTFTPHEIERVRPDGTVLRIRGQPVPGKGFVTLYSDVTEHHRAAAIIRKQNADLESRVLERTTELQQSEQRLRLIMDSIPALVAYFDNSRVYRYLNRGYQDWFGIDTQRPEIASARQFLGEGVYAIVRSHVMRALAGEAQSFEYELRTHNGQQLTVRTALVPEHDVDGSILGCFELTFDTTEQKRSQALIARAHRLESLGHLTGGLAHDFNNILTVVIGNLDALMTGHPHDELIPEYVQPALDAARRGAQLIRALLSFARRQPLQAASVHVGALLDTVARLVRRSLPETLSLHLERNADPLWTWIDATLLEQALINLVLNARDASGPLGHIVLRAYSSVLDAARAVPLQMSPGACICIEIEDDGTGMDSETLARIFEPFFTTKRPGSGTGLGMAVVYGFIRQSGGAIDVKSILGKGTIVTVWLPASVPSEPSANASVHDASITPSAKGLALLVDDDIEVRRVMRRLLLEMGYAVLESDNGSEALQLLHHTPGIELVLSDVFMPGAVDGVAVARAACDAETCGVHPRSVVLMSGNAPDDIERPEGVPLLIKPFTAEQLARAVGESRLR